MTENTAAWSEVQKSWTLIYTGRQSGMGRYTERYCSREMIQGQCIPVSGKTEGGNLHG